MRVTLRAYFGDPVIPLRVLQIWQSCCRMSKAKYLLSPPSICFLCRVSFVEAGQEISWKKFGTKATSFSWADTGHTDPGYLETERKKARTDASFWSTLPEPVEISTLNCCGYFFMFLLLWWKKKNIYIYIYTYVYIHINIYIHIYIHINIYTYTYKNTYTHTHIYIYIYTCTSTHTHIHIQIHMHMHIHIQIHVNMHMHIHIHIHIYIHIYIYIYVYPLPTAFRSLHLAYTSTSILQITTIILLYNLNFIVLIYRFHKLIINSMYITSYNITLWCKTRSRRNHLRHCSIQFLPQLCIQLEDGLHSRNMSLIINY